MIVKYNPTRNRFEATWDYSEFNTAYPVVKNAGFAFEKDSKLWHTAGYKNEKTFPQQVVLASKLFDYCDEVARIKMSEYQDEIEKGRNAEKLAKDSLVLSRATTSDVNVPCPDAIDPVTGQKQAYLPYQKAGIVYAMQRTHTLIGDEMGLGKTIQGIGISNADPTVKSVLIVSPATPKINWSREWKKWCVKGLTVGIMNSKSEGLPDTDVVIINFDIAKKFQTLLRTRNWDLLIIDECHKVKNPDAQRTQAILGKKESKKKDKATGKMVPVPAYPEIKARRHAYLTGTPILNRPVEMWPMIERLDPEDLGRSFFKFAKRYCNAVQTKYGWDFSGASNLDELQEKLRSKFMVRRLKKDVLTELPAKRRQVVLIEPDVKGRELIEKEKVAYEAVQMKKVEGVTLGEMSSIRKEVAVYKVPFVIEHLDDMLEDGGVEKVCVFAHHMEVVDKLMAHFGNSAVKIDGRVTKVEDRQAAVDRFQTDPTCKVFVGSIQAAGVAITLTAASHAVFAELDWVPGNVSQAEDRIHRMGQKNSVLIQHILLEDSLDANMINKIIEKQRVIDAALDTVHPEKQVAAMPVVGEVIPEPNVAVVKKAVKGQDKPAEVKVTITPEQVAAIHQGLQMLSGVCNGARDWDGMGFSKTDTNFGKSLAAAPRLSVKQAAYGQRLIQKYQGQLPTSLVIASGVSLKKEKLSKSDKQLKAGLDVIFAANRKEAGL